MSFRLHKAALRVAATAGHPLVEASLGTFALATLARDAAKAMPRALWEGDPLILRFQALVLRCARLVALASFAAGAVMAMQFGVGMGRFGAKAYVPTVVATSVVQALAPMLAALMAAARSGGGLAAEVAGMLISQQIDAIRTLGSDPNRKLHAPSLIALTVGLPLLTVVADLAGLAGGLLIEVTTLDLPWSLAYAKTIAAIQPQAAVLGILKTAVAGFLIAVIATREGLRATGGASGIGVATTSAVIRTTVAVLLADLVLTKLIWLVT
jgi:phospholipid/cholesterol/gamma-HCH transport system permease protein